MPVTDECRMSNLARANEIRFGRADAKRAINRGEMTVVDAMALECCQSCLVWDLLTAQRRWGPMKAVKAMSLARIGQFRTVEDCTERQREALRMFCPASVLGEAS